MKKAEKRQAEEFLDLLEQAHSEIRKSMDKKDIPTALTLLADCQEGAIGLGNLIEATEGEGFVTIAMLEEYCELVYRFHESLAGEEKIEAGKVYKHLQNQAVKIRNSVRNDIQVRKEVVFLPYKASMWDSLESVWKAANEDPDCDAYVVPIPYYDKNPDGSFREMHYEGNIYPKDVPVTWYKDYDFAEHRPDMIFIHNPYDEYNYVTSVHPDFYSNKLKEYTDKLVYIPYFILAEPKSDNVDELEGMAHFCTVPGVINADQIIVQSEEMRKAYISILSKAYGEKTRAKWAKKILGSGSPKVDKVLNTRKEELEIPEEWLKIIQKPDGSWKKIILYNTSVNALLKYDEKMLVKIQDVFRVFKENQDDVALLWRPHPLIQATIESMRPHLWMKYRQLREQYRTEGWGIYDDSADMDRALCLSDAYYGDASSVVQLCQKVDKTAMIQYIMNCQPFDWNSLFYTYKMVENKGNVWFFATLFNGLFSLDVKSGEIEWKGKIPKEKDEIDNLFRDYLIVENKIYFAPTNAENIVIYDIEKEQYQILALDIKKCKKNYTYASVMQHGGEILFIGVCGTSIICKYSIDTGEITYIKPKGVEKIKLEPGEGLYGFRRCIREDILYIPLLRGGCALKVNLQTEKAELLQLTEQKNAAFNMAIYIPDKDVVWFVSRCGYIIQWDERTQEKVTIKLSDCNESVLEEYISYKLKKDKLYLFPKKWGMKYKSIDVNTGECVETLPSSFRVLDITEIQGKEYFLGEKSDGRSYVVSLNEKGIKEEVLIHRKDGELGEECFDEYRIEFFKDKQPLYYEGECYQYGRRFEVYLNWIKASCDFRADEKDVKNVNIGKEIWNNL